MVLRETVENINIIYNLQQRKYLILLALLEICLRIRDIIDFEENFPPANKRMKGRKFLRRKASKEKLSNTLCLYVY